MSLHLQEVKQTLAPGVELVAVSKFHSADSILKAYEQGQRIFGESRAQELQLKHYLLPQDIQWHFVGHLQPNKVKMIAPYISLIHSVDSMKLLMEINKQGAKNGRVIDCLLQLHLAEERTKFGFTPLTCKCLLQVGTWKKMDNVRIVGIMCMATNTTEEAQIRQEFHAAQQFFQETKDKYFANEPSFRICSWGMSGDYHIAMEEGSNMVRIGSAIFGERDEEEGEINFIKLRNQKSDAAAEERAAAKQSEV